MDNLTQHRQSPLNGATFGNKKNIYLAEKPFATTLEIRVNPKSNTARKIEKTLKIKFPKQVGQTFRSKSFTGMCAQGVLSRSPVIIYHGPVGVYHLYVRASFAQHLWNFMTDASIEYLKK